MKKALIKCITFILLKKPEIIKYEEYTANVAVPGLYPVILSVSDNASNSTSITFYIEIIDNTPPVIEGEKYFISTLSSPITISDIQSSLSVTDNVDKNLNSQIFVCSDNYSLNKNIVGTYSIYFCVYDSSENLSNEFMVTIEVKDDIPPVIEGLNYYNSYLSSPLTIQEIISKSN